MVDFIVGILNSIGSGVGDDLVADLLKTPAEYNAGMYQLSLTVARSAVKPIASTILAIMCVLELARVSTRADGDRELGVKLVAMAMFKLTLVFTAAQHSELMLQAIDEVGDGVLGGIHSAALTTGASSGLGLGDSMRDAIDSAGWMGQIPCLILLLIPFLVSKGATVVVTVVILLRFVQIYMLTAFNPLPIAFIAQEETRQWGINYFKQYASLVFQCATLYLAILMYRTLVGGTLNPSKFKDGDSLSGWVMDNFTGLLLASVMLIGIVMAANSVAKKLETQRNPRKEAIMALQMPVYRELTTIESKVFMGMSWRQCLAAVILAIVCGGGYVGLWLGLGMDPNLAMYLIFPPGLPIAVWGWVRPKGLMPEKYLKYILRHYTQREVYLLDGPGRPYRTGAKPTIKER